MRVNYAIVFVAVASWLITGLIVSAAVAESKPVLSTSPNDCLVDEIVQIKVTELPPAEVIAIRAEMTDSAGKPWKSHAVFQADASGRVDVSSQAPTEGTYSGVDPMGLIWSAKPLDPPPSDGPDLRSFSVSLDKPLITSFEVVVADKVVATGELRRRFIDPAVTIQDVKHDGMIGKLYLPPGKGPFPALLVLTGSDGGIDQASGGLLASRGFAAFSLAYFRAEGLPDHLVNIPLDYLKKGIDWFVTQPAIDKSRLGVIGGSKGGELALLLASTYPELRAVVAYVPSHVVWQGISMMGPPPDAPSWTLNNQPMPYLRTKPGPAFFQQFATGKPLELISLYASALDDKEAVEQALIPVEKIRGPVMLVSGRKDLMWPSAIMAEAVVERLRKHNHPFRAEHLCYDDAGHAIRKSYLPAAGTVARERMAFGGTEEANAKAQADSWPKVLRFLRESLK